jgi:putative tryptophan/tyrosine transport system substrate-binding protein
LRLVRLNPDVIITHGGPGTLALKQATSTIPIVMAIIGNPVEVGAVASLARPGGNITGSSFLFQEVNAKRVDLLKAALPDLVRVGLLVNPENVTLKFIGLRAEEQIAQALNLTVQRLEVRRLENLDAAFKIAKTQKAAVVVPDEALFSGGNAPKHIADLAVRNEIPSIGYVTFAEAGGLIGYGVDWFAI